MLNLLISYSAFEGLLPKLSGIKAPGSPKRRRNFGNKESMSPDTTVPKLYTTHPGIGLDTVF